MRILIGACCVLGAACAAEGPEQVSAASNELGIASVTIDHERSADGRALVVTGYDASGNELAHARVFSGRVLYMMDGADAPEWTDGTELSLRAGASTFSDTSPNQLAYVVRRRFAPAIQTFVELAPVASAIRAAAGITFDPVARTPDSAYGAWLGSYYPQYWPSNRGGSDQACVNFYDYGSVQTVHRVSGGTGIAIRSSLYIADLTCTQQDGSTGCTSNCYYGPCAFHIDWVANDGYNDAIVFHPWYPVDECGWDASASVVGGAAAPYDYTNENAYGGVSPSCPYTGCNSDGTPF